MEVARCDGLQSNWGQPLCDQFGGSCVLAREVMEIGECGQAKQVNTARRDVYRVLYREAVL